MVNMVEQQDAGEDIVIAGAGVAGLAVALGLHRKGVGCVVLESSPVLRTSGFAIAAWTNAFRALDALGVGDTIRRRVSCLRQQGTWRERLISGCKENADPMKPGACSVTCCSMHWRKSFRQAPSATPPRSSPSTTKTATATAMPRSSISPTAPFSVQRY
ncbi:hypothetical protein VPH35_064514 [Triticum aestivum]